MKTEPAIVISLVAALLGLAASFGLSFTRVLTLLD